MRNYEGNQYWYEYDADLYLPIDSNDHLQFTSASAPSMVAHSQGGFATTH